MFILRLLALLVLSLNFGPAFGQANRPLPVDEAFQFSANATAAGIELHWQIAEGYYLYRDAISATDNGTAIVLDIPRGEITDDPTFGHTETLRGALSVVLPALEVREITVGYQGCLEGSICYPPVTRTLDLTSLTISTNAGFGAAAAPTGADEVPITIAKDMGGSFVSDLSAQGGPLLVLGGFLLFGMALAFTPCVFPMYPILAGTLTRGGASLSTGRAFAVSATYVLGMASAFGLLGVVAAWSGQNLQMVLQSPWAIMALAMLFVVLATSMFGAFELQLPSSWLVFLSQRTGSGSGLAGAGVMGFLSALIVGPCVTAPLAGALIYIAQTGDAALGAAALFALGLGKGVPLIVFGTVGGKAMPKAGPWMDRIKHLFGFVFIGAAIWMLSRILPSQIELWLWAALVALVVIYGLLSSPLARMRWQAIGMVVGTIAVVFAGTLGIATYTSATAASTGGQRDVILSKDLSTLQDAVRSSRGQYRLVYVTADWCVSCVALDREIWTNPAALAGLEQAAIIKIDVSRNTPEDQSILQALQIYGPPTILFLDGDAVEIEGTRLIGEVSVETFRDTARLAGMLR